MMEKCIVLENNVHNKVTVIANEVKQSNNKDCFRRCPRNDENLLLFKN